ncbi:CARDB domain-containing protein [Nocardioides sp. SYSU D00038]|uniref:CARDB domain-containing protein n=1 Tax=Nocardioides sp. SYSU D00038 TaxID=2812554 RepID=UPI001967E5E6|nr:CARDB domain-containing protein [Nocardioides sp. SYSU D00038]
MNSRSPFRAALLVGLTAVLAVPALHGGADAAPAKKAAKLTITSATASPGTVKPGQKLTVKVTVANKGKATSKPTKVKLYLSADKKAGNDKALPGSAKVKALKKGKKAKVTVRTTVAAMRAASSMSVLACVGKPSAKTCKATNTKVAGASTYKADLTGTLTFTDKGAETGGNKVWDRTATATIKMSIGGADPLNEVFTSHNSTYTYTGTENDNDGPWGPNDCQTFWDREETGGGTLKYTGDTFKDDIYGWFTHTSLNRIRLSVWLRHGYTLVTTRTGDDSCSPGQTTTTGNGTEVVSMELTQVPGTNRFKVTKWEADMGTASDYEKIDGQLTLARR